MYGDISVMGVFNDQKTAYIYSVSLECSCSEFQRCFDQERERENERMKVSMIFVLNRMKNN